MTGANVNRRFAIILDEIVDSAPVIRTKIGGGRASITMGAGDPEKQLHDANQLVRVLKSGALPAPITPSNESLIGPSLGRDAIHEAVKGVVYGVSAVLLFMFIYYRKSGIVADLAVLFNLFLQLAVLASFSATMTLPGVAGLALTIGMSIDANVLINERIREELRAGKSVRAAVDAGYDRAWPSIIDGHMTVFISGLILARYGSGPVKGFAVTLSSGFFAVFSRASSARGWCSTGGFVAPGQTPERGSGVLTHGVLQAGTCLRLHGQRRFWIPLSFILVIGSSCSAFIRGRTTAPTFAEALRWKSPSTNRWTPESVRQAVEAAGFQNPDVVQVVDPNNATTFSSVSRT